MPRPLAFSPAPPLPKPQRTVSQHRRRPMAASAGAQPYNRAVAATYPARAGAYHARAVSGFHADFCARLLAAAPPPTGGAVLDVACGTGLVALSAARAIGEGGVVVGVDICKEMIGEAMVELERVGGGGEGTGRGSVRYLVGDVEDPAVLARAREAMVQMKSGGELFDAVYCSAAQVWFDDLEGTLRNMREVVRHGGAMAFNAWSSDSFVGGAVPQQIEWARGWRDRVADWLGRTDTPHNCCEVLQRAGWEAVCVEVPDTSDEKETQVLKDGFEGVNCQDAGWASGRGEDRCTAYLRELFEEREIDELRGAYCARVDELSNLDGIVVDNILTYTVVGHWPLE
jgi:SAM-dependent methyltransferase